MLIPMHVDLHHPCANGDTVLPHLTGSDPPLDAVPLPTFVDGSRSGSGSTRSLRQHEAGDDPVRPGPTVARTARSRLDGSAAAHAWVVSSALIRWLTLRRIDVEKSNTEVSAHANNVIASWR